MSENISGCLTEFFPYFNPFASQLDGIFLRVILKFHVRWLRWFSQAYLYLMQVVEKVSFPRGTCSVCFIFVLIKLILHDWHHSSWCFFPLLLNNRIIFNTGINEGEKLITGSPLNYPIEKMSNQFFWSLFTSFPWLF